MYVSCARAVQNQNRKRHSERQRLQKRRGFAVSETTCPMRSVCSTVATTFKDYPVLPVRTDGEIPKDKIDELMKQINAVVVSEKLHRGDVVLKGVCGKDVNLIATASIY